MTTSTLHEKAASYSLADDIIASRNHDRERFLERFPLEKIATMTIDEYVAGNASIGGSPGGEISHTSKRNLIIPFQLFIQK